MNKLLYSLLIYSSTFAAIDTGTGADGACNWSGSIPSQTYNCTDLTTTGNVNFTGTNPIIIKVQGDVTIDHTFNLDGLSGTAGGSGIAGGYDGGAAGANGNGPTAATRGNAGGSGSGLSEPGAGASGGSHGSLGIIGSDALSGSSVGGSAPTATFDNINFFKSSMSGGASGGGGGDNLSFDPGGAGGGGAGVLRISAGGTVTINNTISANGGSGENSPNADSGGGGGGAGGAIFIETNDHITIAGFISATGGAGGAGNADGGAGGAGGSGLIRLDDSDGVITGVASTNPSATAFQTGVSVSNQTTSFTSDISPGCALRITSSDYLYSLLLLFFGFIMANLLLNFNQRQKINSSW